MTAIAKIEKRRNFGRWQRRTEAHDDCLMSFRCIGSVKGETVTDNQLRLKGFLNFWDSVVDPLAGTKYVICTQPVRPKSTGAYFHRVGRHMAWVMREPDGEECSAD